MNETFAAAFSRDPATADELRAVQAEMNADGLVLVHRDDLAGLVGERPFESAAAERVVALCEDLGRWRRRLPPDADDYLYRRIVGHLEVIDSIVCLPAARIVRNLIAAGECDEDEAVTQALAVVESRTERLRLLTGTGRPGGSRRAAHVAGRRGDEP